MWLYYAGACVSKGMASSLQSQGAWQLLSASSSVRQQGFLIEGMKGRSNNASSRAKILLETGGASESGQVLY